MKKKLALLDKDRIYTNTASLKGFSKAIMTV